jgi:hypothetical protein
MCHFGEFSGDLLITGELLELPGFARSLAHRFALFIGERGGVRLVFGHGGSLEEVRRLLIPPQKILSGG